ncbi:hypothetical protein TPDSL_13030 [Terrisporobacter petrolearius]
MKLLFRRANFSMLFLLSIRRLQIMINIYDGFNNEGELS